MSHVPLNSLLHRAVQVFSKCFSLPKSLRYIAYVISHRHSKKLTCGLRFETTRDVALTIRLLQLFCFVVMLVITMFNCFRGRRGGRHRAGAGGAGPRPRAGPAVGLVATARRAAATAPRLYYRQRHTAVATAKQQSCRTGKYTFQTFELEKLQYLSLDLFSWQSVQ